MAQNYMDADGLFRQYGTDKTTAEVAGEYKTYGSGRLIEIKLDLTTLVTSADTIISNTCFFPKNVRIESVEVSTDVAATGTGATLDLGLIATDRTTEIDYNGLLTVFPLTSMDSAGETTTVTATTATVAGALLGTTNATVGYFTARARTAVFTAGSVFLRIKYNVA